MSGEATRPGYTEDGEKIEGVMLPEKTIEFYVELVPLDTKKPMIVKNMRILIKPPEEPR